MPSIKKVNDSKITIRLEYLLFKYLMLSGIKSIIDIQIITPDAKAHEADIILRWSLILIKMGIVPNMVASPAIRVKING